MIGTYLHFKTWLTEQYILEIIFWYRRVIVPVWDFLCNNLFNLFIYSFNAYCIILGICHSLSDLIFENYRWNVQYIVSIENFYKFGVLFMILTVYIHGSFCDIYLGTNAFLIFTNNCMLIMVFKKNISYES